MNNTKLNQALIVSISLILHLGFFYALKQIPNSPNIASKQDIELIFKKNTLNKSKHGKVIKELQLKKLQQNLKKLQKEVQFLSENTKRFKDQQVAKKRGLTENKSSKKSRRDKVIQKLEKQSPTSSFYNGIAIRSSKKAIQKSLLSPLSTGPSQFFKDVPDIKFGNMTLLNTNQFTYYAFYNRLNQNFGARWVYNVQNFAAKLGAVRKSYFRNKKHITQFEAVLDPNGELLELFLHRSSGVKALDHAAISAINAIAPIKNPPEDLIEDDGLIHIHYALEVTWGNHYVAESPEY